MSTDINLMAPVMQYGFAGFSVLLLAMQVWMVKFMFKMMKDQTAVIARNTETFTLLAVELRNSMLEVKTATSECRDKIMQGDG